MVQNMQYSLCLLALHIFILVPAQIRFSNADQNSCNKVDGKTRECMGLLECQETSDRIKNGATRNDLEYFFQIKCGFGKDGNLKVCCPVENTTPSPPSTTTSTTTSTSPSTLSMPTPVTATTSGTTQEAMVTSAQGDVGSRLRQEADSLATQEECMETRYFLVRNGEDTSLGEYPFMALLWRNNTLDCGASLISHQYVLTAAHCADTVTDVRLGEWRVNSTEDCDEKECADPVKDIPVDKVIIHEDFNNITHHNDIALIRLKERIEYTKWIRPICIPRFSEQKGVNLVARTVTIAGWGRLLPDSFARPDVLQKGYVKIFNNIECNIAYTLQLRNTQLCAGSVVGVDTCKGDSGGPVIVKQGGFPPYFYVGGIVSLGYLLCGTREYPAIYTNVAPYVDWIENHVNSSINN